MPETVSADDLDDTIRVARNIFSGLEAILKPGHPIRGIQLAELGKLLAVDETRRAASDEADKLHLPQDKFPPSGPARLKLAVQTLKRAHEELLVGFGTANEGGQVGREVRDQLVELERELGVWNQGIRNVLEDRPKPLGRS